MSPAVVHKLEGGTSVVLAQTVDDVGVTLFNSSEFFKRVKSI